MTIDRVKELQKDPGSATDKEVRALAYLYQTTFEVLMLRNQQIRLLKERMKDVLTRSIDCQRTRLINKSHFLFWQVWAVVATLLALWLVL